MSIPGWPVQPDTRCLPPGYSLTEDEDFLYIVFTDQGGPVVLHRFAVRGVRLTDILFAIRDHQMQRAFSTAKLDWLLRNSP